MYHQLCYIQTNQVLEAQEAFLQAVYGFRVKITARITTDYDKQKFTQDCLRIQDAVNKIFQEENLKERFKRANPNNRTLFEKTDPYYISLKLCVDKYPFIYDEEFVAPFNRSRSAITKAKQAIQVLLAYDMEFKGMYEAVLNKITHEVL